MKFRRIGWVNMNTGEKGYGNWLADSKSSHLEDAVRECNEQCPNHVHFIELRDKPPLYREQVK